MCVLSHSLSGGVTERTSMLTYASDTGYSLVSLARYRSRAYLSPLASNTLASTLPTRFPAALGIGHG